MGNDPDADLKRAQQLFDLDRAEQARTVAASVLAARPNSAAALRLLARCHMALGRHHEAVRIAKAAVVADPSSEHGFRILSAALRRVGRRRESAAAAAEAVRLAPQEWRTHLALAQSLYHLSPRRALAAAEEARRLAPQNSETHYLCGAALRALNRPGDARAAYLRALEIDPQHTASLNGLALLDQGGLRLGSAVRGFRRALGADPQHPTVQRNLEVLFLLRLWSLSLLALAGVLVVVAGRSGGTGRIRALAVGCEAVLLAVFAISARSAKKRPGALGVRLLHRNLYALPSKAAIAAAAVLIAIAAVAPEVVDNGAYIVARVSLALLDFAVLLLLAYLRFRGARSPDAL